MDVAPFVQAIRANLEKIENPQYASDYDQVAVVLSVAKELIDALPGLFGPEKLSHWKENEESTFDRFAAILFKCLQGMGDYLEKINPELLVESNVLQAKLQRIQVALAETQKTSSSLLAEGGPLFARMEQLLAQKEELETLRKRKALAETIAAELAGLDLDVLRKEVAEMEAENQVVLDDYQPLVDRKIALEESVSQSRSAIGEISGLIDGLEMAQPGEMTTYVESLTNWTVRIGSIQNTFQDRVQVLQDDLNDELDKLKAIVAEFQENLRKSMEFSDMAFACQEEMRAQFSANRQIKNDLEMSLAGRQSQLDELNTAIKDQLTRYDQGLTALLNQIDAADARIKVFTF